MTEEIAARGHLDLHRPQVPTPVTLGALRRARAAGLLTMCNTAPAPEGGLPDELLALCDVLCPNESEAALLTGAPTDIEPYPEP